MKRSVLLFWHGMKGVLIGVSQWLLVFLGMKDDSKFGTWIRRVVGCSWAVLMALVAWAAIHTILSDEFEKLDDYLHRDEYCYKHRISEELCVHEYNGGTSNVVNGEGKHVLSGLEWVVEPQGKDSLACYSDGNKRGYFNIRTGQVVVKPKYTRAWCFSEGLAAVQDDGIIKFIDQSGNTIINTGIPYQIDMSDPVFHAGHCIMQSGDSNKYGMLNRQGDWLLPPVYDNIVSTDSFYILQSDHMQSVLNKSLEVCIPFTAATFEIGCDFINAICEDHTVQRYNYAGEIIEPFCIYRVKNLMYSSRELNYSTGRTYDTDNNIILENDKESFVCVTKVAKCLSYEGEVGWLGLMSSSGEILTQPVFQIIEAVDEDLYYCQYYGLYGILLDGNGNRVE